MFVCKQICTHLKNEITDKILLNKSYMYIYLNVCKRMTHVKLFLT